jgi:hypothetical protein
MVNSRQAGWNASQAKPAMLNFSTFILFWEDGEVENPFRILMGTAQMKNLATISPDFLYSRTQTIWF